MEKCRTKIVATLGPSTDDAETLAAMLKVGVDVVRVNFSHGTAEDHRRRVSEVRSIAAQMRKCVAVLGDLQGPKIRIGRFSSEAIELKTGDSFSLDTSLVGDSGDYLQVGIDYADLPTDCYLGDMLLLDDGRMSLLVTALTDTRLDCTVVVGGTLSNHKGEHRNVWGTYKNQAAILTGISDSSSLAPVLNSGYHSSK